MRKPKRKRLEAKGWKIGTVKEFLRLSDEESAYIDLKIKLAGGLRQRRQQQGLSQLDLAAKLQSSQSRVAKMEAGRSIGFLGFADSISYQSWSIRAGAISDHRHSPSRIARTRRNQRPAAMVIMFSHCENVKGVQGSKL